MFAWLFRPMCPCDPAAKQWVEERLRWLVRQFGLHILLERPIVLPTPEFFPDSWDGSPTAGHRLFRRVCEYMGADADDIELEFFDNLKSESMRLLDPTYAAGTWSEGDGFQRQGVIRIERCGLSEPSCLVGTMAHELAHQRLLGEGRFAADAFDNELLTDLTAVYHGFGIFLANNPRKSTGELRRWPGTQLNCPEYLSEPMLGYAMSHIAWFRDEDRPEWARHLGWALRGTFKQGLRFLTETGDSSFKPVRLLRGNDDDE